MPSICFHCRATGYAGNVQEEWMLEYSDVNVAHQALREILSSPGACGYDPAARIAWLRSDGRTTDVLITVQ